MENHILKIEEFVNIISNDYNCGRFESVNAYNHIGYGDGKANGWSIFDASGYGKGIGIEIYSQGSFGDGMARKNKKFGYE